jgi:hypothetical protein
MRQHVSVRVTVLALCAVMALALRLAAQSPAPTGASDAAQQDASDNVQAVGYGGTRPPPPTGPVPRLPDGTVDLGDGVWVGGGPVSDIGLQGGLEPGELPLLPWARALRDGRTAEDDPVAFCLPMGVPRMPIFPWRFVQNYTHKAPTHMFIVKEGGTSTTRQIFMDGRGHPDYLDPSWFGHSIGSWDGDTLVVDTVGYNDRFWVDRRGTPHTEQLHTIERFTRMDLGTLVREVTVDDPGAFSEAFTVTFTARLSPGDEVKEYICQENNQFGSAGGHVNPYAGEQP